MIILDTDYVSLLEFDNPIAVDVVESKLKSAGQKIATTIISYEEQVRGYLAWINRSKKIAMEVEGHRRLARLIEFYCKCVVLDFDEVAAARFQELCGQKIRIGTMDLKIASIALALGGELWSRNLKDFTQVAGLKVCDPLSESKKR